MLKQQGNFLVSVVNDNPDRVFLKSDAINIFPCSRRGQYDTSGVPVPFDPEARLNTERTNRLHTALNGFKNSFIISYDNQQLKFVLAGYYIEIKYFNPADIAGNLSGNTTEIYAHLSLHTGITLNTTDYTTEILYKQLPSGVIESNYLDVPNEGTNFFMGISFTADGAATDSLSDATLIPHNLKLFTKSDDTWQLEQTSLLPKIDHDATEDSVVLDKLHVRENLQVDEDLTVANLTTNSISVPYTGGIQYFPNTEIKHTGITTAYVHAGSIQADGTVSASTFTQNNKPVPSIDVVEQTNGTWQLQISRATTTALPVAEDEN